MHLYNALKNNTGCLKNTSTAIFQPHFNMCVYNNDSIKNALRRLNIYRFTAFESSLLMYIF